MLANTGSKKCTAFCCARERFCLEGARPPSERVHRCEGQKRWLLLEAVGQAGGKSSLLGYVAEGEQPPLLKGRLQLLQHPAQQPRCRFAGRFADELQG